LIRAIKLSEIAIMLLAAIGFWTSSLWLLLAALFCMGLQSTLFGPVKYALLPQVLKESELIGGNALVESGTFIAILFGTIFGGILIGLPSHGSTLVALGILAVAVLGYGVSCGIPSAPAADPGLRFNWNPLTETWHTLQLIRQNSTLFRSILGISWFWFYGALFLSQFPGFARNVLGGGEGVVTLLLAVFSVGIGVGSMLCERLSGRMVEIGLVPFGSIGLSLFALDLWWTAPTGTPVGIVDTLVFLSHAQSWHILFDLLAIGCFGGFFIVPLYALVQSRSEVAVRSRIIAGNNIMNAGFMVVASVLAVVLLAAGLSIPELFLVTGLMNAAVALYIYGLVPEFLLRFVCWILIHSVYRLDKTGVDQIPEVGPALLVCNHVSLVDALVISASCPRPIRFAIDQRLLRKPGLRLLLRDFRVIPFQAAPSAPELPYPDAQLVQEALLRGELVCLFPEGPITDSGAINPFRIDVEGLLDGICAPVIPLALKGMWASVFSRRYGTGLKSLFRARPFLPISLVVGVPLLSAEATSLRLQAEVAALRGEDC
jgi:1-acyl-sn-glycerol-3-phosphate acyltransferase